jgi:hypothetical protein
VILLRPPDTRPIISDSEVAVGVVCMIERHGRPGRLLVLRVEPAVLRRRLLARRAVVDADGAFPVTKEVLGSYLAGFEWPRDEGETLLAG